MTRQFEMIPITQVTRIERVVQAVASVAASVVAIGLDDGTNPTERQRLGKDSMDAENELRESMAEFLVPAIRVIEGGGRPQDYPPIVPLEDRPRCKDCRRRFPCATINCEAWADAVRSARMTNIPDDQPPGAA